ncbi:LYSM-DOMAIN RECEPTOR-LIKE KINASE [Salix viminalis]|uniref:LYSM-DOMAIN RECEPTOR-LIKE KINASE n=1 Tax=Salix viminalis TaxID=40686 RepID=A0A9Q0ZD63_SALVM|nr:LYSM-DOMAIN RECEPTOR-LIKE KINASE [Salix viminalis]
MFLKGFTIFTALTESKGQDFTFQSGESSDKGNKSCLDKTCCGDCRVSCNMLERGEVYVCGAFLLELITWKDAAFTQDGNESLLSTTIVSILEKENPEAELHLHVDPGLKGTCGTNFALCLAEVCVACLMKELVRRPRMEEVVSILLKFRQIY